MPSFILSTVNPAVAASVNTLQAVAYGFSSLVPLCRLSAAAAFFICSQYIFLA